MKFQTWTRKANALDAVKKFTQQHVPLEICIDAVEAVECESSGTWSVVLTVSDAADAVRLKEIIGNKAQVIYDGADAEPQGQPSLQLYAQQTDDGPILPEGHPEADEFVDEVLAAAPIRRTKAGDRKLFCVDGARNPFRNGNGSWKAWELIANNPGMTFSEAKRLTGHRIRAVTHCIAMGWIRAE